MKRPLRTLLLVEDSPEDRGTYRAYLCEDRECEYTFLEAEEAEEALELCRAHTVDCVLLDYHLPGMDGLQFLQRLRRLEGQRQPAVVMLTGRGNEQVAVQALKSGASDYLVKANVTPESLFRAVNNSIERTELRRQLEQKTAEQHKLMVQYRQLAEVVALSSSYVAFASVDANLRYMNAAGRRLLGLSETEDITHLTVADLLTPEDLAFRESHILPALQREGRWRGEFHLKHQRTGARIPVRHDTFLLPGEDGVPALIAAISQDITEEKRQREEAAQRAEFEQYLAGIVGHDLRNPISVIQLSAVGMLRRKDVDTRLRESLSRILSAAERANRLVDTTLDFTQARLGGGLRMQRKPADLLELAYQVVEEARLKHPDRKLDVRAEGSGAGEFDLDRMAQVLTNLVSNALRYSGEDSPVTVRLKGGERTITVEVHNGGNPIPPELLARLFAPLKRGQHEVERYGRSMGLGLFIVDHIIRAHGGSIDVRSDVERGTTFTVNLPRVLPRGTEGEHE